MAIQPEQLRKLADRGGPGLQGNFEVFVANAVILAKDSMLSKHLAAAREIVLADFDRERAFHVARFLAQDLVYNLRDAYGLRTSGALPDLELVVSLARDLADFDIRHGARAQGIAVALTRNLDELSLKAPSIEVYSRVGSIIYVLLGVPYVEVPHAEVPYAGRPRPELEVNSVPSAESVAAFTGRLEGLIREAVAALELGRFDNDDQKRRQVERDLSYLRDEAYETDPEDFLGESLGAMVARLGRNVASVTDIPDNVAPIVDAVLQLMSRDQPDRVLDVVDAVLDESSLDDSEWLESQGQPESLVLEIQQEGPEGWFTRLLGWVGSDHFGTDVGVVRNSGAVGVLVGGGIGLVVAAFLNNMVATSASAATIGGILGVALGWVAVRYRNRHANAEG